MDLVAGVTRNWNRDGVICRGVNNWSTRSPAAM
jgi:hypothetical protein